MTVQNDIPFMAIIIESLAGLFMLSVAVLSGLRYQQKRSRISIYIALATLSIAIGGLISATGKYMDFYSEVSREEISYSDFTIAIAYTMLTLANIFFSFLLAELYLHKNNQLPLLSILANSTIIGLILSETSFSNTAYEDLLFPLLLYLTLTILLHGTIFRYSIRERRNSEDNVTGMGFGLIALFNVSFITVLILFILDLVVGIVIDRGYTVYYYLGWIMVAISTYIAYLGFLMPEWFKRRVSTTG